MQQADDLGVWSAELECVIAGQNSIARDVEREAAVRDQDGRPALADERLLDPERLLAHLQLSSCHARTQHEPDGLAGEDLLGVRHARRVIAKECLMYVRKDEDWYGHFMTPELFRVALERRAPWPPHATAFSKRALSRRNRIFVAVTIEAPEFLL